MSEALADFSTIDEEHELLRRFSSEACPVPIVSIDSRLQLHGRYRAEFLSLCARGEHLNAVMPSVGKPHRHTGLIMHMWHSYIMLREAVLTEMLLLPPQMEKQLLAIAICAECQAAAWRILARMLRARIPNIEGLMCLALQRADALAVECRAAEMQGAPLAVNEKERRTAESLRDSGTSNEKSLASIKKQAERVVGELKRVFPVDGSFAPPRQNMLHRASREAHDPGLMDDRGDLIDPGLAAAEMRGDTDYEFMAVARDADAALGFGSSAMPPEPVYVNRIEPGGWAERHGVLENDELVAIDGQHTEVLAAQDLVAALRRRPLRLTFKRERAKKKGGGGRKQAESSGQALIGGLPIDSLDELGHREWLDNWCDWWESVVEGARHILTLAELETRAFRPFLRDRDEGEVGALVGLADTKFRIGLPGQITDIHWTRAIKALEEQGADFTDRIDERLVAAMELSDGGAWVFEGSTMKAGDVFKKAFKSNPTPWPMYPGEQLNALAQSVRREVQGAFLSM